MIGELWESDVGWNAGNVEGSGGVTTIVGNGSVLCIQSVSMMWMAYSDSQARYA